MRSRPTFNFSYSHWWCVIIKNALKTPHNYVLDVRFRIKFLRFVNIIFLVIFSIFTFNLFSWILFSVSQFWFHVFVTTHHHLYTSLGMSKAILIFNHINFMAFTGIALPLLLLCVLALNTHDFFNGAAAPREPEHPHYRGFTITLRHTTLVRTPPDEWSARRRDLYLATHNTQKR
jgi:hypothetical protein